MVVAAWLVVAPCWAQSTAQDKPEEPDKRWTYDGGLKYRSDDDAVQLDLQNRFQGRFTASDPELGDSGTSFDVARFKVALAGLVHRSWKFRLQVDLANGSESDSNLLEDAFVVYSRYRMAQFWFGQGKVFFGRQQLIYSDGLQFVDRSIAADEFVHNPPGEGLSRDVGLALIGENAARTYGYQVGVYNGNGINKDDKDNTDYMAVARLVATPFGEMKLVETDPDRPAGSRLAIGVSVIGVTRGTEAIAEKTRDVTAGLEIAYRHRGFNLMAEFFSRSEDQPLGAPSDELDTDGWYVQAGYLFRGGIEIAARYSLIDRETLDDEEEEVAAALNYYIRGNQLKLQTEFRQIDYKDVPATGAIDTDEFKAQLQVIF